ncbi:MAG: hypothetical protein N2C14_23310, partial [Planctomycetales bacterium]
MSIEDEREAPQREDDREAPRRKRRSRKKTGIQKLLGWPAATWKTAREWWGRRGDASSWNRRGSRAPQTTFRAMLGWILLSPVLLPVKLTKIFWKWAKNILNRSRGVHLVQGLPAALIAVLAVTLAVVAYNRNFKRITSDYAKAAKTAVRTKEFQTARVCFERLRDLGAGTQKTQCDLAKALFTVSVVKRGEL